VAGGFPDADAVALVAQYLLVLAHAQEAESEPAARQRLLAASAGWSPVVIADAFQALPARWRAAGRE
jgi:hypothetical protein